MPPRRATVLVVEDEPALRRATLRMLDRLGYNVLMADSGRQALGRIELGQVVDLVISDLHLPDLDGIQLHDELRRSGYPGPFLLMSNSDREDLTGQRDPPCQYQ